MEIQEVTRTMKGSKPTKSIVMSIRVTPEISEWMTKRNIMPSKVFNKAIEELIESEK